MHKINQIKHKIVDLIVKGNYLNKKTHNKQVFLSISFVTANNKHKQGNKV